MQPPTSASGPDETEIQALRDFAEMSSDWFWEQDAELRFTRFYGVSPSHLRRKPTDFLGKRRWDMQISGITDLQLQEHIATCERHEPFRNFVYEVPGDGGVPQYYAISGTPIFNAQGEFQGYRGIGRNITALHTAELSMAASERQLAQILEGSAIATFVLDALHRVTHWNQACARLTGKSAAEMIGGSAAWSAFFTQPRPTLADLLLDSASDDEVARHYPAFSHSSLVQGAMVAETLLTQNDPVGRWVQLSCAPLRDQNGNLCGAMETLQDISGQKEQVRVLQERTLQLELALQNLEQTRAELAQSERLAALGSMVAGISHELNTPLGNALLAASSMNEGLKGLDKKVHAGALTKSHLVQTVKATSEAADLVLNNVVRASDLVRSFKQAAVDQTSQHRRVFDLATTINDTLTSLRPSFKHEPWQFTLDLPNGVEMDSCPGPLGQVIVNLVLNSIRHGFEGRAQGQISIRAHTESGKAGKPGVVVLELADDGAGIRKEHLGRVFDPFFTTKLGKGGSGLGLNIVHGIATNTLGGSIQVYSEWGEGTRFVLRIPQNLPT